MTTETRKLAAIMFTDMVGFSAMSQRDEKLALELLETHRAILRSIFPNYNGNEIKTIGDAFMVEFGSALDAVNCAVEIQKQLKEFNEKQNDDGKVYLRIGIHVGDVVFRDGDLYGDGVNISSRLEPLALPGGICISEDVARLVMNKVDVNLQKMSKQDLKNIQLPVDIYQIMLYADANAGPPKIDKNKLAVLPFSNISADKSSDYFSDGLTEELTMHLSKINGLRVVSRTTSMKYKDVKMDIVSIGKELKARYILEGSVRKSNNDLRITAQLIDVETDTHLWAESYSGNMDDIFNIQTKVSEEIVDALRLTLTPEEKVALSKQATANSEAYDFHLHARKYLYRGTKSSLFVAEELFQKAIELDPRYAGAYAGLGEVYIIIYEWHEKKPEWLEKTMEMALKALMYDSEMSEAYSSMSLVYYHREQVEEALTSIKKAIELDEDSFFSYWILGRIYRMLDDDKNAEAQFLKVLELNPDFHSAYPDLRMTYTKLGEMEKAQEITKKAAEFYPSYILRNPDDARAIIFYAMVLLNIDQVEKAKTQMARAINLSPNDAVMIYNAACFYGVIGDKDEAVAHLKKAVAAGYEFYEYIERDPDLDLIREEPGYLEIMQGLASKSN